MRPVLLSLLLLAVPSVARATSRDVVERRGIVAGPAPAAVAASTVAGRCDVNGDGRDDLLTADNQRPTSNAYVVFGDRRRAGADLAGARRGLTIRGPQGSPTAAVGCAGDVDRDGRDDVPIGADGIADRPGRAFVIFGARAGTVDTARLGWSGYAIEGVAPGDNTGYAVAGLPDLNGDRRPEALVGAYDVQPAGRAYVVFGRRGPGPVLLSTFGSGLPPEFERRGAGPVRPSAPGRRDGFVLEGRAPGDRFGRAVAPFGSGFAVGADAASPFGRERAGQAELFAVDDSD